MWFKTKKEELLKPGTFTRIYIPRVKEHRLRRHLPKMGTKGVILTKRRKFVLVALLLSLGLFGIQAIKVESRYLAITLLAGVSYLLSAWSMWRDLRGVQWFSNLILPTMYPSAIALFYFLLPQAFLVRIGVNIVFAITMYALLLTSNIYAVASIRTIQLLRAARAIGFLLTILTSAFYFQVIFALQLPMVYVAALVFVVSFLIFYQGVWTHTLSIKGDRKEFLYALLGSAVVLEGAVAISFWLIDVALASVMLAMMVYVVLGLFQQDLEKRLFKRTVQEYLGFAIIVLLVIVTTVLVKWVN